MLTRRHFCLSAPSFLAVPALSASREGGILVSSAEARRLRGLPPRDAIRKNAEAALRAGPWSVTTHRPEDVAAGPNDYYSEGPYWWPDPKNPKGPYIRKDGQRNPARFMGNRNDLGSMCSAVLALGLGGDLLGDKEIGRAHV